MSSIITVHGGWGFLVHGRVCMEPTNIKIKGKLLRSLSVFVGFAVKQFIISEGINRLCSSKHEIL
jgi:hypothetical protein